MATAAREMEVSKLHITLVIYDITTNESTENHKWGSN